MRNVFKKFWRRSCNKNVPFSISVIDVIQDDDGIRVIGGVNDTVCVNSDAIITNYGDDDKASKAVRVSRIKLNGLFVGSVTDCVAEFVIDGLDDFDLKFGSVIHTSGATDDFIYSSYTMSIIYACIINKKLDFSTDEIKNMSLTDCTEVWRLFLHLQKDNPSVCPALSEKQLRERLDKLVEGIASKLLEAQEIYMVYSRATGDPFMFSRTFKEQDDVYASTPPRVSIISKALIGRLRKLYTSEFFEIKKIERGEDDRVVKLLSEVFYLNGACGIQINSNDVVINREKILAEPDYSELSLSDQLITNPDLVKCLLLKGQLGKVASDEEVASWYVYHHLFSKEISKAKFLVPVQKQKGTKIHKSDENEQAVLTDDLYLDSVHIEGKNETPIMHMFTDQRRFDMMYRGYNAFVVSIDEVIDKFACAINPTKYAAAGCYIDKEIYTDMLAICGEEI